MVSKETCDSSRHVAAKVLVRVWDDEAFASAALNAELQIASDSRSMKLAPEYVYGVLRTEVFLTELLNASAKSGKLYVASFVRAHLLIAAYEVYFLPEFPKEIAVSRTIDEIREHWGKSLADFANALLRKFVEHIEKRPRVSLEKATAMGAPSWLKGALRKSLGRSESSRFLEAGPIPPLSCLAVREPQKRNEILSLLQKHFPNAHFEMGQWSPHAILYRSAGDIRCGPGFGHDWIIQEEGAQMVALALGVQSGACVLDACSGRGNKAWILSQQVGVLGAVDVCDVHSFKLRQLKESPVGTLVRNVYCNDWSQGIGVVPKGYDYVLVDAPCSGIGTFRRRPEIVRKHSLESISALSDLQTLIAYHAAGCVKQGGTLLFAVCSVLQEEAEQVVERLIKKCDAPWVLHPAPLQLVGVSNSGETSMRLLPQIHGTDGYFLAKFTVEHISE